MQRSIRGLARFATKSPRSRWICPHCCRSMASRADTMRVGDRVLLQPRGKDAFMSKKLEPEGTTAMQAGAVKHSDIIGKRSRDTVKSTTGRDIRAFLPTLAEYVTLTPRLVTPVYPSDASLIVSLLDINVDTYHPSSDEPTLEILEGGTGHGSLTLHLARAIHAANPPLVDEPPPTIPTYSEGHPQPAAKKAQRQAVIHTIDISERHCRQAQQTVSGFRQGMYSRDIDFHVGDVSDWIDQQFASRGLETERNEDVAFLSHVILDMPNAHQHLEKAVSALHVNGGLLVFNPSISQIMTIVKMVKEKYLPLQLERVVELGPYLTGGKEWDVRSVKPRAQIQAAEEARKAQVTPVDHYQRDTQDAIGDCDETPHKRSTGSTEAYQSEDGWEMVCRPKVGYKVTGGGFVGFFKKMKKG